MNQESMIYDDEKLQTIFDYWQCKKYPQHLKIMIYEYMLKAMSYKPKMLKLQYEPDYEGQEGYYLRVEVGNADFEYVAGQPENYLFYTTEIGDEIALKSRIMDEKKFKFIRSCYLCGDVGDVKKLFVTKKRVYNVTKEQATRFILYCVYKYYIDNPMEGWKVYIPPMVYHAESNQYLQDYTKICSLVSNATINGEYTQNDNCFVKLFHISIPGVIVYTVGMVILYKA